MKELPCWYDGGLAWRTSFTLPLGGVWITCLSVLPSRGLSAFESFLLICDLSVLIRRLGASHSRPVSLPLCAGLVLLGAAEVSLCSSGGRVGRAAFRLLWPPSFSVLTLLLPGPRFGLLSWACLALPSPSRSVGGVGLTPCPFRPLGFP